MSFGQNSGSRKVVTVVSAMHTSNIMDEATFANIAELMVFPEDELAQMIGAVLASLLSSTYICSLTPFPIALSIVALICADSFSHCSRH